MRRTRGNSQRKMRRQMSTMLKLQARAFHLSHIKRYHSERKKRTKSYGATNPGFGILKLELELPVYPIDLTAETSLNVTSGARNGWIQFLNWNSALHVVAEIREDFRLVSVATGAGASFQHRILRRLLAKNPRTKGMAIASVGVLHFRGLAYTLDKDSAQMIVPLRSSMAQQFRLGRTYNMKAVLEGLRAALAHRRASAVGVRGEVKSIVA